MGLNYEFRVFIAIGPGYSVLFKWRRFCYLRKLHMDEPLVSKVIND